MLPREASGNGAGEEFHRGFHPVAVRLRVAVFTRLALCPARARVALVALLVFAINSNYKWQTKTQKWATSVSPGIGQTFNYLDEDAKVACFFTQFRLQFWFSVLGRDQRGVADPPPAPEKVNSITQFLSLFMLLSPLLVVVCAVRFGNYKQLYKLQLIKLQAPWHSEKPFAERAPSKAASNQKSCHTKQRCTRRAITYAKDFSTYP